MGPHDSTHFINKTLIFANIIRQIRGLGVGLFNGKDEVSGSSPDNGSASNTVFEMSKTVFFYDHFLSD